MNTPKKIYFGFNEQTHLESYCLEKKRDCQIEYIRKDIVEELKKRADAMYSSAQYLTTDASRLGKAMEEYWHFINLELNLKE
jgi:regulator of sirC expression with transglutaminase-like and TPR domain